MELITGRKPVDASQPLGDESLVEWVNMDASLVLITLLLLLLSFANLVFEKPLVSINLVSDHFFANSSHDYAFPHFAKFHLLS